MILKKEKLEEDGFAVVERVFNLREVEALQKLLNNVDGINPSFRRTQDLFAIRKFLIEVEGAKKYVLNDRLKETVHSFFGKKYFVVKSIYFDKPGSSNWFVSYHQDLTISVKNKTDVPGFGPWTTKQDLFAVQPPLGILENIYTIRIHLDDTDENNGALRVIPGSHKKGIYRRETINLNKETEAICAVPAGGIMIMKPLLLHASSRTHNEARRRVIHIEFADCALPAPLEWAERLPLNSVS